MYIDIKKRLGAFSLSVKTEIKEGSFVALMGESGAGKSTLLRVISGLEEAEGIIKFEDTYWLDGTKTLPVQKRDIGFVFQDFALFENMSVKEHLGFVSSDKVTANEILREFELENISKLYPKDLSGGQKQRVSICRALIAKPKLLLMDEPFSALDKKLRLKVQNFLKKYVLENQITTIMVTHESQDLYRLADRVIELKRGKIVSERAKSELIQHSNTIRAEILRVGGESIDILADGKIFTLSKEKIGEKRPEVGEFIDIYINTEIGLTNI